MSDYAAPPPASPAPILRDIDYADVKAALRAGWQDFRSAPRFGLFFGGFYALGGLVILALLTKFDVPWLAIPLAIGFPLIGPFAAAGLYEVSRRLTAGEPLEWPGVLGFMFRQSRREFSWMAFVVLFIFWIWMYQVRILFAVFFGSSALASPSALAGAVFGSGTGIAFLAVGTLVGAVLALALFSTTVIGMPLLVDREHDVVTAIVTSIRSVIRNLGPMLFWAAIIAATTIVAMLPLFLGLIVALPVLGHATWHLYRRTLEPL